MDEKDRERGTVIAWGLYDPYGWATRARDPRGRQVFLHRNQIGRRLEPGTAISFELKETAKGLRGENVEVLSGEVTS